MFPFLVGIFSMRRRRLWVRDMKAQLHLQKFGISSPIQLALETNLSPSISCLLSFISKLYISFSLLHSVPNYLHKWNCLNNKDWILLSPRQSNSQVIHLGCNNLRFKFMNRPWQMETWSWTPEKQVRAVITMYCLLQYILSFPQWFWPKVP